MKKIYTAIIGAALFTANAAFADVFTVGDLQYTTLDESTCQLTKSFAGAIDLVIPSKVTDESTSKEYTVTSIKLNVFRSSTITSCVVPGTILKPGPNLFNMCRSLKSVTFEEGVEELGYNSFPMCTQLTTVNLPSSLKVLGGEDALGFSEGSAFEGCTAITSLKIPSGITEIPEKTFSGCTALASVTFEGKILKIGRNAFNNCTALATDLAFPEITSLGVNAFGYCSSLKKVELGGTLEAISNEAFYGCGNLEEIGLSEGLKTIGSYAFNGCGSLKSVVFPASVTEVGSEAFKDCSGLTSVSCMSEVPPTAYANTFSSGVYSSAILSVPAESDTAYGNAECWKLFNSRVGLSTGVGETFASSVSIKTVPGAIVIEGTEDVAEIYTLSGQMTERTVSREISLPAGIYILRIGGETFKTIVR